MTEDVQIYIDDAKQSMDNALSHLDLVLSRLRAGKASPALLDSVVVDYYGNMTPLARVSSVSTPDARTIRVQPWEKNLIPVIEKAILTANLGFNPSNNGEAIIVAVPPLTEERRHSLVKQSRHEGENAKVSIRNTRRETLEELKKLQKEGVPEDEIKEAEELVQKLTDQFNKKVEDMLHKKEQDIMTV